MSTVAAPTRRQVSAQLAAAPPPPPAGPAVAAAGLLGRQRSGALAMENDDGAVEYKWRLVGISGPRLQHLVTQMKYRVAEGQGQCLYELGVEDDGYPRGLNDNDLTESLSTLRRMSDTLGFQFEIVCERDTTPSPTSASPHPALTSPTATAGRAPTVTPRVERQRCVEVRIRKVVQTLPTCRVAVMGDTGSGKSTLVGVISTGELDDGSGTVRQSVFTHKHELRSGQTSSVSERVIGFAPDGHVVNYADTPGEQVTSPSAAAAATASTIMGAATECGYTLDRTERCVEAIAAHSATLALLMDLPGHLKRTHTALSALVGRFPHVTAIVADPASIGNLASHVAQCASMRLPFFVIFTKQDAMPPNVLGEAATAIDRAVGAETGKRVMVVNAPIYPGEEKGGFDNRMMQHASSDMFLSDLGSDTQSTTQSPQWLAGSREATFPRAASGSPTTGGSGALGDADAIRGGNLVEQYLARFVPVFVVSCVTGHNVGLVRQFLHQLSLAPPAPPVEECTAQDGSTRVVIYRAHRIPDIGTVLSGVVTAGAVSVGQRLYWGPSRNGNFHAVTVGSIHVQRSFVFTVAAGNDCAIAVIQQDETGGGLGAVVSPNGPLPTSPSGPLNASGVASGTESAVATSPNHLPHHADPSATTSSIFAPTATTTTPAGTTSELDALLQRKGTVLWGPPTARPTATPAAGRHFTVVVSSAPAVRVAESWREDQELTAFVFNARQSVSVRKVEVVEVNPLHGGLPAGVPLHAASPRLVRLHLSFLGAAELLACGAQAVLLHNTTGTTVRAAAGFVEDFEPVTAQMMSHTPHGADAVAPFSQVASPAAVITGACGGAALAGSRTSRGTSPLAALHSHESYPTGLSNKTASGSPPASRSTDETSQQRQREATAAYSSPSSIASRSPDAAGAQPPAYAPGTDLGVEPAVDIGTLRATRKERRSARSNARAEAALRKLDHAGAIGMQVAAARFRRQQDAAVAATGSPAVAAQSTPPTAPAQPADGGLPQI